MNVQYNKVLCVDTESNPDGSLYLVSLYDTETHQTELFYSLKEYHEYIFKLGNIRIFVHNFGDWDSYFLITPELAAYEKKVIAKDKKIFKYSIKREYQNVYVDTNNRERSKKAHQWISYEDTLPKTMISLEKFAKTIGEPYLVLPDYDIHRTPEQPETWLDRELIEEYARKDVYILYKLLESFREAYGSNFDKTVTAGSLVWREVIQHEVPEEDHRWAHSNFRKTIVELDEEVDVNIRKGYMGGITTPFFMAGKVLTKEVLKSYYPQFTDPIIRADDISSAYAWAQVRDIPIGKYSVIYNKSRVLSLIKDVSKTVFIRIKFKYDSCVFPVIPKMNMDKNTVYDLPTRSYLENKKAIYMQSMLYGNSGVAVISSLDLRYALDNNVYENLSYELLPFDETGIYGYSFNLGKYDKIVDVTNKYYDLKNTAPDPASRQAFKSPLVNLYGKTGERVRTHENKLDVITRDITQEELEETKAGRYSNVAVASTITSYVHHKLFERGKEVGFTNMLYCDTDSMFFVTENNPVVHTPEELGTWNNEIDDAYRSLFICPKKYILENKDKSRLKSASAGISRVDYSFTIDNWEAGKRIYFKKEREQTDLGIRLVTKEVDATDSFAEFIDPSEGVRLWKTHKLSGNLQ